MLALSAYPLEACDGCSRGLTVVVTWDNRRLCEECKYLEIVRRGWLPDAVVQRQAAVQYQQGERQRRERETAGRLAREEAVSRATRERELAAKLLKEKKKSDAEDKGPTLF